LKFLFLAILTICSYQKIQSDTRNIHQSLQGSNEIFDSDLHSHVAQKNLIQTVFLFSLQFLWQLTSFQLSHQQNRVVEL
jgi:hypothetical protein